MVKPNTAFRPIALVLAAGRSSRTAPDHKLLAHDTAGQTMLARTVSTALHSNADQVVVVVPPDKPELSAHLSNTFQNEQKLHLCLAHDAADGLSASLRAGIEAAEALKASSVLVCLADMPLVSTGLLNALLAEHRRHQAAATAPDRRGRPGNPVVWSSTEFAALKQIRGDKGGRALLQALGQKVHLVPAPLEELVDFDTPERLAVYARLPAQSG